MRREQRYTNVQRVFLDAGNPFAGVTMDTWYYSEWPGPTPSATWASPTPSATLGGAALGDGPLTAAQGVVAFVARQVFAFRESLAGLLRPTHVSVGFRPRLDGVESRPLTFRVPERQEDVQAIQTAMEQYPYEGITSLSIPFAMLATVRDERGWLSQVWLPYADPPTTPRATAKGPSRTCRDPWPSPVS